MKQENFSKYCVKGCLDAWNWCYEKERAISNSGCHIHDDSDYYFVTDIEDNIITFGYETYIPDDMQEVTWPEFLNLLMEDYESPYKVRAEIPKELGNYCFKGCEESKQWSSESQDDLENCEFCLDEEDKYYSVDGISENSEYIYSGSYWNTMPGNKIIIPWEQYKAILLSKTLSVNPEIYY